MKNFILFPLGVLIFFFLFILAYPTTSNAAFLIVDENGELEWQVLSRSSDRDKVEEDKTGDVDEEEKVGEERKFEVEVRTTDEGQGKATGTEVRIKTEDGRVKLRVATPSGQTEMDVTNLGGDIVRVRERVDRQEIRIRARGERLEIRQKGVGALTHFPISVDPQTNQLTVTTPAGIRVVAILPSVAVANILESNIMDRVLTFKATASPEPVGSPQPTGSPEPEEAELEEEEQEVELEEFDGKLVFKIQGVKDVRLLNLFPLQAPVTARVSAQTGETLSLSRPWFLDLFGFLFSQ